MNLKRKIFQLLSLVISLSARWQFLDLEPWDVRTFSPGCASWRLTPPPKKKKTTYLSTRHFSTLHTVLQCIKESDQRLLIQKRVLLPGAQQVHYGSVRLLRGGTRRCAIERTPAWQRRENEQHLAQRLHFSGLRVLNLQQQKREPVAVDLVMLDFWTKLALSRCCCRTLLDLRRLWIVIGWEAPSAVLWNAKVLPPEAPPHTHTCALNHFHQGRAVGVGRGAMAPPAVRKIERKGGGGKVRITYKSCSFQLYGSCFTIVFSNKQYFIIILASWRQYIHHKIQKQQKPNFDMLLRWIHT